jgi:hypothetical protein
MPIESVSPPHRQQRRMYFFDIVRKKQFVERSEEPFVGLLNWQAIVDMSAKKKFNILTFKKFKTNRMMFCSTVID